MNVLLSIKPKYAESIIKRQKKYEFRKILFKCNHIDKVYIYATAPVKKVIGLFQIGEISQDSPESLWEILNELSGLNESEFFSYFKNNRIGFAIEIKHVRKFQNPVDPKDVIPNFHPPQSFCYIERPIESTIGKSKATNYHLRGSVRE